MSDTIQNENENGAHLISKDISKSFGGIVALEGVNVVVKKKCSYGLNWS